MEQNKLKIIKSLNSRAIDETGKLKTFSTQLLEYIDDPIKNNKTMIISDNSKSLSYISCINSNKLLTIKPKNIRKLLDESHGLSYSFINSLEHMIENSVLAFESTTQKESVVIMLDEIASNGNPYIVTCYYDKKTGGNPNEITINEITSVYNKREIADFLNRTWNADKTFYVNKKTRQYFINSKRQLQLLPELKDALQKYITTEYENNQAELADMFDYNIETNTQTCFNKKMIEYISSLDNKVHKINNLLKNLDFLKKYGWETTDTSKISKLGIEYGCLEPVISIYSNYLCSIMGKSFGCVNINANNGLPIKYISNQFYILQLKDLDVDNKDEVNSFLKEFYELCDVELETANNEIREETIPKELLKNEFIKTKLTIKKGELKKWLEDNDFLKKYNAVPPTGKSEERKVIDFIYFYLLPESRAQFLKDFKLSARRISHYLWFDEIADYVLRNLTIEYK